MANEVIIIPSKEKSQRYTLIKAQCVFYKTSEPMAIRCEGINNTIIKITFESRHSRKQHEKQFCCANYRSCPYASLHNKN